VLIITPLILIPNSSQVSEKSRLVVDVLAEQCLLFFIMVVALLLLRALPGEVPK
jgi:hypothetical protein